MYFSRLEECGGFHFGLHHDKGLRPPRENGVEAYPAITGACMVMRRSLAVEMGGFDEAYILGDFEDTDLCLKLQARGYRCVVDPEVRLFHLERKSQESCAVTWRGNLTLYNAWRHDRLWAESIAARQR